MKYRCAKDERTNVMQEQSIIKRSTADGYSDWQSDGHFSDLKGIK